MKKNVLILILVWLFTVIGRAQQFNENIYIQQAAEGNNTPFNSVTEDELYNMFSNLPIISNLQQAISDANQVAGINTVGDQNIAELTQLGMNNFGIININGSNNNSNLYQKGSGLLSVLNIQGNSNSLDVDQIGNDLQNYIEIGGSGLEVEVDQGQNGARITQFGTGNPLIIETSGRIIPIIIKNK